MNRFFFFFVKLVPGTQVTGILKNVLISFAHNIECNFSKAIVSFASQSHLNCELNLLSKRRLCFIKSCIAFSNRIS